MDYSPWLEREIWPFLKVAISPKPEKTTPTKIGAHVQLINPYMPEFFEPDSDRLKFLMTMDYIVHGQSMVGKGNLAVFESSNISETGEVTPTKIGAYVCNLTSIPYMHEFFEPIPID